MNRAVLFGIAALLAIIGLSLLGSEKEAVAGYGCHGYAGVAACNPGCGGGFHGGHRRGLFNRCGGGGLFSGRGHRHGHHGGGGGCAAMTVCPPVCPPACGGGGYGGYGGYAAGPGCAGGVPVDGGYPAGGGYQDGGPTPAPPAPPGQDGGAPDAPPAPNGDSASEASFSTISFVR